MALLLTNALVPSALLLAACAAHHYSSTPPRIAQKSSNHLLLPEEKRGEASPQGQEVAQAKEQEALHDGRRLSRFAMRVIAGTKVCPVPSIAHYKVKN